jgi:two-component system, chemotaxis family, chemotaxis protein CheY
VYFEHLVKDSLSKAQGHLADMNQLEGNATRGAAFRMRTRKSVRTMDQIRALIVDDSSVMRKIVERSLRQAGLELSKVLEAGNGAEALAVLAKEKVDLILCDINMPVMDGLEFVKQLATMESAKGIPVVMITTEGSENHVIQALSAGAKGYIRKPFTPEQVKEHVLPVVGKKS